jgi:putative colanic acid biosynthesis acetyltransferase WcaF
MSKREADPYLIPQTSAGNRLVRLLWDIVYKCLFRPSPRPLYAWRRLLLRLFGARMGPLSKVSPTAKIWAPWNLICESVVAIGPDAIIYNPKLVRLGSHAILSQESYLCGATHDYDHPAFPTVAYPMNIGRYAWICARAAVQPGVTVGEGAVLALGSVATKDLEPWTVYGGIPARRIKARKIPPLGNTAEEQNGIRTDLDEERGAGSTRLSGIRPVVGRHPRV